MPPKFSRFLAARKRRLIGVVAIGLSVLSPGCIADARADNARHVLARTGYGVLATDWQRAQREGVSQTTNRLIQEARKASRRALSGPVPDWVNAPLPDPRKMKTLSEEQKKALKKQRRQQGQQLRAWWVGRMLTGKSPLLERMTLFWHNHFTSSLRKVKSPRLMYQQNQLFRRHALGRFDELLMAIAQDPAMVVYLDSASNKKASPNENFARELLELFTLGEGHYSEQDIKEAARAFTGWSVNRKTGKFVFRKRQHDAGSKTFLGQTGRWNGDDILRILLKQPRTAETIVEKLWKAFVSPTPDPVEVARLGRIFRQSGYRMDRLLTLLLQTPAFLDPANRGVLIKSPVDLLVGAVRELGLSEGRSDRHVAALAGGVARASRQLGQDLFAPPNVKGWPGGEAWIDSNSLLNRKQAIERLFREKSMGRKGSKRGQGMPLETALAQGRITRAEIESLLLPLPPVGGIPPGLMGADLVQALMLNPVYQLR